MDKDSIEPLGSVIGIDARRIERHVSELVRGSVEKTSNELLDAEAVAWCKGVGDQYSYKIWLFTRKSSEPEYNNRKQGAASRRVYR